MFLYNGGNPGVSFQSFTMGMIGILQAIFMMMCVIIFSYFKEGYLETTDDVSPPPCFTVVQALHTINDLVFYAVRSTSSTLMRSQTPAMAGPLI